MNENVKFRVSAKQHPQNRHQHRSTVSKILSYLSLAYLPLFLFLAECLLKISLFNEISLLQTFYALCFSLSAGLGVIAFCRLFACGIAKLADNDRIIRPLTGTLIGIVSAAITLLFLVQYVYFSFFSDFFKWSTLDMAGDVTQFYREILAEIAAGWYWILIFALPCVLFFIFPVRRMPSTHIKPVSALILVALSVFFHFGAVAVINLDRAEYGQMEHYTKSDLFNSAYLTKNFGLMTATRLDLTRLMFGTGGEESSDIDFDEIPGINQMPDIIIKPSDTNSSGDSTGDGTGDGDGDVQIPPTPIEYDYNLMDIDFDTLIENESNKTIREMHEYFSSLEGSKQNEYTGYFKGKNLIFITLEGFSSRVIDKDLTPTLYKMATEGFVFNNFYNSLWGGSTATGEYAAVTGNFYNSASCLKQSASTYQPFALGNMFSDLGYKTTAYHNHTYTYYSRHLSHTNFGYEWIAVGNGLQLQSSSWPNSDLQLALATVGDYASSETPFLTYYMTVSGHANYTWGGNSMARKHKERVAHLDYSENVKAYIACNLEVEDMLTELMAQLEAAGTLDDTVFVITEDHYPYALEQAELAELYGLPDNKDMFSNFDLYRNFFTVYSTSMEKPVIVDEPCSAIDILPTVLNLFGVEYDSRLITGTDVLSETPCTVILNCDDRAGGHAWNWITRYGVYDNRTKQFTPAEGVEFPSQEAIDTYVSNMNTVVKLKRTMSYRILDYNYYKYVLK